MYTMSVITTNRRYNKKSISLCLGHEVVIEEALPLGQLTHDHVLKLLGHLFLHLVLQAPQQKGTQHLQGNNVFPEQN